MPTAAQLDALQRWLRDHHNVVTVDGLAVLGFARDYARTQVDARRWQRVHRGVYCTYTGPLTFETRCAAALAACGEAAVIAAATALAILGMPGYDDNVIHVLMPHSTAAPRLAGVRVTRSATLTERSHLIRQLARGPIERAAVGFALLRPGRARAVLTAAVQRGLTTPIRLRAAIFAMGRVNGRRRLVQITHDVEGGDRSVLERLFIRLVARAGLPRPLQSYGLRLGGRQLWIDVLSRAADRDRDRRARVPPAERGLGGRPRPSEPRRARRLADPAVHRPGDPATAGRCRSAGRGRDPPAHLSAGRAGGVIPRWFYPQRPPDRKVSAVAYMAYDAPATARPRGPAKASPASCSACWSSW